MSFPHFPERRIAGLRYLYKLELEQQLCTQTSQALLVQAVMTTRHGTNEKSKVWRVDRHRFRNENIPQETLQNITWKSKTSLERYWWDKIQSPYIAAGITSLGDEKAIPLPLIDLSNKFCTSSLLIPILYQSIKSKLSWTKGMRFGMQRQQYIALIQISNNLIVLLILLLPEDLGNYFSRQVVGMLVQQLKVQATA